jgi:hypothetical protein
MRFSPRSLRYLPLVLILSVPASADAEFRFDPNAATLSVGPAMLQDGIGTTFFLAGRVDLGSFHDRVVWDMGLHWWQKTETTSFSFFGETTATESRFRDLALTTGVKYLFPVGSPRWIPYARGGLGLNFVNVSVETTALGNTTEASAGDTDLGIYLGGGAAYRYSPSLLLGAEASFNVTDADHFLLGITASFPFGSGRADHEAALADE